MSGRLEPIRWINVHHPAYAAALSGDEQFVAVGSEQGVSIFDVTGRRLLSYPEGTAVPVHQLAAPDEWDQLYVASRSGRLVHVALERRDLMEEEKDEGGTFRFHPHPTLLYQSENDIHSLSLSGDGRLIAVGHLSPGLAVLDADPQSDERIIWRRHRDDRTATQGQTWAAALDTEGETLYVGSAGSGTNQLAALDAADSTPRGHHRLDPGVRVIAVVALPGGGLAAVLVKDVYTVSLVAYDAGIKEQLWERTCDQPVTAIVADRERPVLVVGLGYEGKLRVFSAENGQELASDLTLKSVINGLAIAQGRTIAAAAQDGQLVLLRYLPEEEFYL
jgi:outer membrane protein assembly factor BamB